MPALRVRTNLRELEAEQIPAVISSLLEHAGCGCDHEHLAKAMLPAGGEGEDPRYSRLFKLIRHARRDWRTWGDQLVAEITRLLDAGKLLPMTSANEAVLLELLRDHELALVARITGRPPAPRRELERLKRKGLVTPEVEHTALLAVSYRIGRGLDMLEAHRINKAPPVSQTVGDALKVELTPRDREAMAYVQRRGAVFMRRPAANAVSEAQRVLSEAEYAPIRETLEEGVSRRWSRAKVARELQQAVVGNPSLTNDFDRVARTEMVFAHNHGAYMALKHQADGAGLEDPEVYKMVSPNACRECKRIWGPPGAPKRYRLSFIEQREAAGGNFRLKRAQWGPVIGPIHPNCTEGPLQIWHRDLHEAIEEAAAEVLEHWGIT